MLRNSPPKWTKIFRKAPVFMQSTTISLMRIEVLHILQPFAMSVMWDIASGNLIGLIFAIAHPGKFSYPGLMPAMQVFPRSQSFTNEWRFPAHADGVSLYGMVCLLYR